MTLQPAAPFWISLYMKKILFYFLSLHTSSVLVGTYVLKLVYDKTRNEQLSLNLIKFQEAKVVIFYKMYNFYLLQKFKSK